MANCRNAVRRACVPTVLVANLDLPAFVKAYYCRAAMDIQLAGSPQRISCSDATTLVVETQAATPRRSQFAALRARKPLVVPSLLLCDFAHLADEVHKLEDAGACSFHLDVMDGHFVPNLSYGLPIVEAVRRQTELPIETHLMISNPGRYLEQFIAAGTDAVTFHVEAVDDPRGLLERIRSLGAIAGLACRPDTPVSRIAGYLDACDLVMPMSVQPGFGGQAFDDVALAKLEELRGRVGPDVFLEVDGGVNAETIGRCAAAGADLFVIGSAIFDHSDYSQAVATLTRMARTHARTH
jgi:ribulose-phosphate 3-epimerase